jgi:hypothetical protein
MIASPTLMGAFGGPAGVKALRGGHSHGASQPNTNKGACADADYELQHATIAPASGR